MKKISFFCLILITSSLYARSPQGEYSSLLENHKKRSDFKNEKELLNYVKKHDKKITKQLKSKRTK